MSVDLYKTILQGHMFFIRGCFSAVHPEILTQLSSAGSWREQGEPVPQEERVQTAGAGGVESGSADSRRWKGEGHAAPPAIPQHPSALWSFSAWAWAHCGTGHNPTYHSILPQPVYIGTHVTDNRRTFNKKKQQVALKTQLHVVFVPYPSPISKWELLLCSCSCIYLLYLFWVAWKHTMGWY